MKPHPNGHRIIEPADCRCDKRDERRHCYTCDAGLSICADCGAGEAELDRVCPAAMGELIAAAEAVRRDLECDYGPDATEFPDPYVRVGTQLRLAEAIYRAKGIKLEV